MGCGARHHYRILVQTVKVLHVPYGDLQHPDSLVGARYALFSCTLSSTWSFLGYKDPHAIKLSPERPRCQAYRTVFAIEMLLYRVIKKGREKIVISTIMPSDEISLMVE